PWIGRATGADAPSPVLKIVPDEPVIRLGAEGSWDRYIETVCVLRDEQADGYQAWFLGYRERGGATGFVAPAIGQMHSADKAGTRWERAVAPIYRPQPHGWDGLFISGPTVVRGLVSGGANTDESRRFQNLSGRSLEKQRTGRLHCRFCDRAYGGREPSHVWIWSFIRKLVPSTTTVSA